jgi:hypothetical protein
MSTRRSIRFWCHSLAVVAVVSALSVDATPRMGHAQALRPAPPQATFVFGREGGNIRPYTVTIYTDGTVTASGPVSPTPRHLTAAADTIAGLLTLARAEGFFALPTQIVGHGLPDVGGRFIRIQTAHGTKTVHVRFVRVAAFDQLYAVLLAVAGMTA